MTRKMQQYSHFGEKCETVRNISETGDKRGPVGAYSNNQVIETEGNLSILETWKVNSFTSRPPITR